MAPVKDQSIVRYSSQDEVHRAENILVRDKKWLSHKNDKTGRLEVEIHLAKAIKIGFVNVGNAGSGFIELLVGSSMWSAGSNYVSFLPSTVLMSPNESKLGQNTECVKMLSKDSFIKNVSDQEWDRIRVICRQPFSKEKQFGLQFIDFVADDKLTSENQRRKGRNAANATPKQTLAQFRRCNILSPKRNQSTPGRLLSSPTTPLNRAASILQLAAQKGREKPTPKKPSPTQHQRRSTSNQKRTNSSSYTVSAGSQRRKTQSRSSAGDLEDEVECFFESIDFDKIPLESITYRHLLEQIEKQRGCEFTEAEKKIFLALAKRVVRKVLAKREEPKEKKPKSSDSPPTCIDIPSPKSAVVISSPKSDETMVECPMCERFFLQTIIEAHASICSDSAVQEETADTSDDNCWFPGKYTAKIDVDKIEVQPRKQPSVVDLDSTEPSVPCPICHGLYPVSRITVHANICVEINPSTIVL